jgi:CheY-like chemotaxis protein
MRDPRRRRMPLVGVAAGMNERSESKSRDPAAFHAATPGAWPELVRVRRRITWLVLTLVASLTLPHLLRVLRSPDSNELSVEWLAVGVGGGLLVLGAALLAIRRAVVPDLDRLEQKHRELETRYRSDSAGARETSDYLRDVSHEIRATMHAVLGLTQLLSRSPLDATQHRQTRTIDGAARALLRIMNDLIALAGPAPRHFDLVPMGCSLHDMLRVSADLLEPSAKDKGLALELHVAVDLPDRVLIDVGRVQQVVLGVCRHAIETCDEGTLRIDARAQNLSGKRFDFSLCVERLSARSSPAGPTPATHVGTLERALSERGGGGREPNEQEPPSAAGLALSRRLAVMLGGSLRLGEPRGKIELCLPVPRIDGIPEMAGRAQRSSPLPPPIRLPATAKPILVVEADDRAQMTAVELLEDLGFDVEVASSVTRALERVAEHEYALILLATELPGNDGQPAAETLRAGLGARRPAIVGCTSEPLADARARPAAASLDSLLPKPLDRTALCATLADWLPDETHPVSSGTRLSQSGALAQATRRALTVMLSAPPASALPDLATDQRSERLLELFGSEAPEQVRALERAALRGRRDEVAVLAERLGERSAGAGALKMAALCRTLSLARELTLEQLGANARALGKALDGVLATLGSSQRAAENAPASAKADRTPDSP